MLLTNPIRPREPADAKSIFNKFAEQIDASVNEFNTRMRGSHGLQCERTSNRIAVYKELYPQITVELEFDEATATVSMRRQRLEHPTSRQAVATDPRYMVDRTNQVFLDRADYCRLARQALRPLIEAFE
jgi:hypothetical protein